MKIIQTIKRFTLPLVLVLCLIGALVVTTRPRPVQIDLAVIERGPIRVTINEDGQTRVTDRYVVFSPLEGQMERITLKAGDAITQGQTILARIDPSDPTLIDARTRAGAEARINAAEASVARNEAQLVAAKSSLEYAQSELSRITRATEGAASAPQELDDANLAVILRSQEARSAEFSLQIARFELDQARAALVESTPEGAQRTTFEIPAPITGRILRVFRDSAGVVAPGAQLLEIGDTNHLEIQVDVLSQDAVRIAPGDQVLIERWGGGETLNGRVRLVEPSGFTKISALGVEEQRVYVIIDFTDPAATRDRLGDGFRVDARIVIDEAGDAVLAPTGAVFPHGDGWATFVAHDDRAELRPIVVGLRNDRHVQVIEGLTTGDRVIVYPSDRVVDEARIRPRRAAR